MYSCKTADLRTVEVRSGIDEQRGKSLLAEMAKAHALPNWDRVETYSLHLTDEFTGMMGAFSNPFPKNKADFHFQAIPNTFTSKVKFLDGKWENNIWGMQSWRTYSGTALDIHRFDDKNDKNIEFWLPTYQYFIEIPSRVFEADVISFAGERTLDGNTYNLVFVTWKSSTPQRDVDQYMLWIDQETHVLRQIQYTVRDKFRWIHATLNYTLYETHEGMLIPVEMNINLLGPHKMKTLHRIKIEDFEVNKVPREALLLDPELGTKGKQGQK